jgi:hypothetical protein
MEAFYYHYLPDYIFVGDFAFGFSQYSKDSRKSAKGKLALKGMIWERISSIAECKETANLNLTSSSANF